MFFCPPQGQNRYMENKNITKQLKELRKQHNYTQGDVSDLLGIQRSTYANYESYSVPIPIEIIEKIMEIYHVDANYIFGITTTKFMDSALRLKKEHRQKYWKLLEELSETLIKAFE
jgi:transcriptional regulator with XRE-family HTH domain